MAKIIINGKIIVVKNGITILEAAKEAGIEIPHFCYHPCLSISGNCRICAVEIKGRQEPVISCKEIVSDGMNISTDSELIQKHRQSVLEFILINHPLDCPVCDKAGECKLQNYYFDYSLKQSRFKEQKVNKPKMLKVGQHIIMDAERCIECSRCIRFCKEITKTNELSFEERSDRTRISIFPGNELNNQYSLCTVDLCPVGALTSIDFRFKKRVWFLKTDSSICNGCATGCNIYVDHHDNIIYRWRPRENNAVNKTWMCDYGSLFYKNLNPDKRILSPLLKSDNTFFKTNWDDAFSKINIILKSVDPKNIGLVLSAQATKEENEAFYKFFHEQIKSNNIFITGKKNDPNFKDDILRDSDMNPNTNSVIKLSDKKIDTSSDISVWFVLGELLQEEITAVKKSGSTIILITPFYDINNNYADIVLPQTTHLEQDGTFINKNGIEQSFNQIITPPHNSLSGVKIAEMIRGRFPT